MFCLLKNKKAQNTMEYALIIAVVIGVFSAMQIYIKRSLQGRVRTGTDQVVSVVGTQAGKNDIAKQFLGTTPQYEPYYITQGKYDMTTQEVEGKERSTTIKTGGLRDVSGATSSRTGSQTITGTSPSGAVPD